MNDIASRPNLAQAPRAQPVRHHEARRAALACMLTLAAALGIGRFAFTPLLPLMLHGGGLDLRHGSWLASLNYAGYFAGAMACAALRFTPARVVRAGLVATALLTIVMGLTQSFWMWAIVRFVAGAVSAATFVFASQWGLRRLTQLGAHAWSGVIYTGPGVGIVATGLLVSAAGGLGARAGWIGFGLVCALIVAIVWPVFVETPRQAHPAHPAAAASQARAAGAQSAPTASRADAFWLVVLYGVPGFGYIITATFLPVIARHALPGSIWPDLFWPMFGAALIVGALCAARLPLHWDNRLLLAACYVLQALGIASGIVWPNAAGFSLGSVLIGLPFTAITLFAMREARIMRGDHAAALMGYATGAYGIGQILGPLAAAPLAASSGSFSPSLWLAALSLVAGAAGLVWRTLRGAKRQGSWRINIKRPSAEGTARPAASGDDCRV
ncbi:putative MFS family arabinose efflux permease [Paraburkholderia bannensis]|uniref:Putative MFS family arabinose efflux permease n=1 Tax=Paraburkholderia bannensis TaxID=765414 RepID=A0A7W9U3A6_9BURK|nr:MULTISPECIES: YbfB/YjiJ family MFS transporter [Paraburkholderia]MBB3261209.1 putative MFS family arabinose efflux permease [Paraburkholderia sp. WP4_3_2]MBB6106246.1 putative MFS family arabinose efflux permease [Paraburkholderia bannensis]